VKHRIFQAMTALSLLLAVTMAVLWVRSYWLVDALHSRFISYPQTYICDSRWQTATSWSGQLEFRVGCIEFDLRPTAEKIPGWIERWHRNDPPGPQWSSESFKPGRGFLDDTQSVLGFGADHNDFHNNGRHEIYWELVFPHWLPLFVFLILPALQFDRFRLRRRRLSRQYCAQCGYDLRATPDRCPECGNVPSD
jgi:hypothetical protein